MTLETDMLRMLEPVMRPAGIPARPVQPATPIERRDFAQLLEEARRSESAETAEPSDALRLAAQADPPGPMEGATRADRPATAINADAKPARAHGADESLGLMRQLGQIVNLPNRTVVTVLDRQDRPSVPASRIDSTSLMDDPDAVAAELSTPMNHGPDPRPQGQAAQAARPARGG